MPVTFSRQSPSQRYQELVYLYRQMHQEGETFLGLPGNQTFPGESLLPHAARIRALILAARAANILDYGSGKGRQYAIQDVVVPGEGRIESIQEYWGVDYIHCYDPGYAPFATLPGGRFDGVIATDVLEHCPEADLSWIANEIFDFAQRFVFASVACYAAQKRLPNGENAHCTVRPAHWWQNLFRSVAHRHPGIAWEVVVQSWTQTPQGGRIAEERFGSYAS